MGPTGPGSSGDWKMLTFDLTSTDNATFVLYVGITNNKITSYYINEYIKSALCNNVKAQLRSIYGITSDFPKLGWAKPGMGEDYTETAKLLMNEAADIILRLQEANMFY